MKIKKIKLFCNDNDKSRVISDLLYQELIDNGFIVSEDEFDLGIAIGGDGSFLRMLKNNNFNSDVYYIGINTGTLGFLQEIKPSEIKDFILKIRNNDFKIESISIQETNVETSNSISRFFLLMILL